MSGRYFLLPVIALAIAALSTVASADRGRGRDGDHDEALRAVQTREALPLARIMEIATREVPGDIIEVELEHDDGQLIYEVEVLTSTGLVRQVEIDARTGAVLDVEDED